MKASENFFRLQVKLILFSLLWSLETQIFVVHRNQLTRLPNFGHFCILFKAEEQKIKQIFNLTKLKECFVIIWGNFEHEVVDFVLDSATGEVFKCLEKSLSKLVAAARLHKEKPIEDF